MSKVIINHYAKKQLEIKKQLEHNRRLRFAEFLGEDCGYLDALVSSALSPYDIRDLLNKGCPKDLAPKILL